PWTENENEDDGYYRTLPRYQTNILPLISHENWLRLEDYTRLQIYQQINEWSNSTEQGLYVLLSNPKDQEVMQEIAERMIYSKNLPNSPDLISLILDYSLRQEIKEYQFSYIQELFISLFQRSEQLAFKHLSQMKLQKSQVYILYGMVLKKNQSSKSLNQLLHYCENNSIVLDNQIYQTPLKCPEGLENYYKALSKPYYIVFTLSQYQEFYKQIPLTMEQKTKHLQLFLENGLHEKLQFILRQGDFSFETYSTAYFQMVKSFLEEELSIKFDNQDTDGDKVKQMDENGNQTVKIILINIYFLILNLTNQNSNS
ncbi:unnamed protein product, partial (macronuclear) [Paramecium tetraurelia]